MSFLALKTAQTVPAFFDESGLVILYYLFESSPFTLTDKDLNEWLTSIKPGAFIGSYMGIDMYRKI